MSLKDSIAVVCVKRVSLVTKLRLLVPIVACSNIDLVKAANKKLDWIYRLLFHVITRTPLLYTHIFDLYSLQYIRRILEATTSLAPDGIQPLFPAEVLSRATREKDRLLLSLSLSFTFSLFPFFPSLIEPFSESLVIKKLRSISSIHIEASQGIHGRSAAQREREIARERRRERVRLCSTRCLLHHRRVDVLGDEVTQGAVRGVQNGRDWARVEHRDYYVRESRVQGSPPWLVITLELASGSVAVQGEEDRVTTALVRGAKSHGNRFM